MQTAISLHISPSQLDRITLCSKIRLPISSTDPRGKHSTGHHWNIKLLSQMQQQAPVHLCISQVPEITPLFLLCTQLTSLQILSSQGKHLQECG